MTKTIKILLASFTPVLLMGAPPCSTPDIAVRITFSPVYDPTGETARIKNDVTTAYEDGVGGVYAKIQRCNGTNDLVFDTQQSTGRTAVFDLSLVLATNSNTPAFSTAASKFNGKINNLYYACSEFSICTFTTYGGFSFNGPDGVNYKLRFVNPLADTGNNTSAQPAGFNFPYTTARLVVSHTPASSLTAEQWTIAPDTLTDGSPASAQVGTLLKSVTGKIPLVTAGQFRVPFKIVITRK